MFTATVRWTRVRTPWWVRTETPGLVAVAVPLPVMRLVFNGPGR
jgi:hypothetical protein